MSISTHVLDATAGRPAVGIAVRLSGMDGPLATGHTDADGRCALVPYDLEPGDYELTFDTGGYFAVTFYPSVTVAFRVVDGSAHHHVPLLLSPWSYTTYRGS